MEEVIYVRFESSYPGDKCTNPARINTVTGQIEFNADVIYRFSYVI